jgi:hypothetical protein
MVFVGGGIGGGVKVVDGLAGVLNSSGTVAPIGSYYVFGITAAPVSSPPPPAIMPLPNSLSFANQNVGTTSASQPVQITNFGGHLLNLLITPSSGFVDSGCPAVLNGGSSCTISVSFAPKVAGPTSGSLTLLDNSGNLGAKQTVLLHGLATAPVSYAAPGSLMFSAQLAGVQSAAQSVVLLNTGTGPLYVNAVSATAPFSQTNNCNPPSGIVPGAACTILVSFTPTAAGSVGGTLTITSNAATQSVNLSGAGSATAPALTASPASLLFPEQQLNIKSASQSVTISNTGKTAVTIKSLSVTGDFKTSTCTSVAAGGTCKVSVTFTPTVTGTRTGTLTIDFATGAQAAAALTGIGSNGSLAGVLSFSPSPLTFNGYTIGDNPSQTVTVTNTSGAATGIQRIFMSGNRSLSAQSQCGPVLAPLATCTITVTFQPTAYGTFTSTLTVVEGSGTKDTVSVTGNSAPDS